MEDKTSWHLGATCEPGLDSLLQRRLLRAKEYKEVLCTTKESFIYFKNVSEFKKKADINK